MSLAATSHQVLLNSEARRRVARALRLIEDAQGQLNEACAVLSSLRYAAPEWKATSKMADRVKAHWYRVRDALEFGARARKICLDPLATEALLKRLASHQTEVRP